MIVILNLLALSVLASSGIAGLTMLRVRLREVRQDVSPICARCNAPADELTDFVCPACGHDVREMGLAAPADRSPVPVYWRAVALTVALAIAAVVVYGWLAAVVPPVNRFVLELDMSPVVVGTPTPVERFEVSAVGSKRGDVITGTIDVDIQVPIGLPLTLRLMRRPARRRRASSQA